MDTTAQLIRAQTAMLEKLMDMMHQKDDAIVEMVRSVCAMTGRHAGPAGAGAGAKSQSTVAAPEPASPAPTEEASAIQSQSKVTEPAEEVSVDESKVAAPAPTEEASADESKVAESQSKSSPANKAAKAPLRSNPKRGTKRAFAPKADVAILSTPSVKRARSTDRMGMPVKRARKTTHMGMQQFKDLSMKRKMTLVKRLWEDLSVSDQELVAYLCYGGMDTVVGCVWARVTQRQHWGHNDKYVIIDLKEARKWAQYRIYTGHSAPLCLTRQRSRDLVDFVQDGALAAVKPIMVDAKDTMQQSGKCIVLPLELYLYLLAAAEGIASFGRYSLQSATLRPPPTDEEEEQWEEEWALAHSWLLAHWQKRCATLVSVFGQSAWRAYSKWRIPRTGYDEPPSGSSQEASPAASPQASPAASSGSASDDSSDLLFSEDSASEETDGQYDFLDSAGKDGGDDRDIWRLIKQNYGEKV